MLSYILPTRDRPERLALTLAALGSLRGHPENSVEVLIIDNASRHPPTPPSQLANGLPVRILYRTTNEGAASRNAAAQASAGSDPRSDWLVMLDDDSYPCDTGFIRRLQKAPQDVSAVSADIYLPGLARRESGGLPEVFIGCGVAIRRSVFLTLGGYDPAFNYYAEEYDLAARMILAGYRIHFDPWFRVEHHKVSGGRDMNTILARLVRNNGWVMQRYAPDSPPDLRRAQIREQRRRYRQIAIKESSLPGFSQGLLELRRTIRRQRRSPMPRHLFDRFTGVAHAREALQAAYNQKPFRTVSLVDEGKNGWVVRQALSELGVSLLPEASLLPEGGGAGVFAGGGGSTSTASISLSSSSSSSSRTPDALVIGTMSPGPMLDSYERRALLNPAAPRGGQRLIAPWLAITERHGTPGDTLLAPRAKVSA